MAPAPLRLLLPTLQASLKYWGPASPTHKLPPSFAGNKDGERRSAMRATRSMRGRGPELPGGGSGRRVPERGWGARCAGGGPECRAPPAELIHHMDEVNDELIRKISHIKAQPQRHFRVERSQPVGLPLTYESGPEEVRAWLEAKA